MKRSEVIRLIKRAAASGGLVFTSHALDEMDAEGETRETVAVALQRGQSFTLQRNGRWRVHGNGLTVVIHIEGQTVLVWTVFAG
jgi:hypothetical protein